MFPQHLLEGQSTTSLVDVSSLLTHKNSHELFVCSKLILSFSLVQFNIEFNKRQRLLVFSRAYRMELWLFVM